MNQSTVARLRVNFFLCVLALFTVDSATVRAADSIVLPVSMTDNRPMIEATINGEGPFHFIVDTGTSDEAVFSERLVKKLALKPTGESESVDGVTLKAIKVPQYTVALKCAGFAANEVKALAIPFDETDGIVGFSLFQKYLFSTRSGRRKNCSLAGISSYRQSANGVELHRSRRNSHDHGAPRRRRSAIRPRFGAGQRHFASVGRGGKIGIQAASQGCRQSGFLAN